MKILAISDLHGRLPELPKSDAVLIAGDLCPDFGVPMQEMWMNTDFYNWVDNLKTDRVIYIFGNHDFVGQSLYNAVNVHPKATCLQDSYTMLEDLKIWGSPWSNRFFNWAFMADELDLAVTYSKIPEDVDIILSHGPPYMLCDRTTDRKNVGSKSLTSKIAELHDLKVLVTGHIHEAYGETQYCNVRIINASLVDQRYKMVNPPVEIEI